MQSPYVPAFLTAMAVAAACLPQTPLCAQSLVGHTDNHPLESYRKARQILDAGVLAIGGAEALERIDTVHRVVDVARMDPAQARSAWKGSYDIDQLPVYSRGTMFSHLDYSGNRLWVRQRDEIVPGDGNVFAEVATSDQGFTLRWMREETPFYLPLSGVAARARHAREVRLHPEGLIKSALRQSSTLAWGGQSTVDGVAVDVISFTDAQPLRVFLFFDATTHLLVRTETISEHSVLGDSSLSASFSDYRQVGPIVAPHRIITRRNDRAGRDYRVTSISFNTPIQSADMALPQSHIPEAVAEAPKLKPRGAGVYEVLGEYNVMFAVFRDYVLLVEAPRDEGYTKQVFDLIRLVEPNKPIKVVATHFHFDHIGGMRYAASIADEIWAASDAKAEIEAALRNKPTIRPDEYARAPKPITVKLIDKRHVFEDSTQRVEIVDVGPIDHADQLLVGYFPSAATMLVADLWDVLAPDAPLTGVDSEQLMARVKRLGWKIDQMLPVHGVTASMATLERSLLARKTYLAAFKKAGSPASDR